MGFHFPQKCEICKSCMREGDESRRVGACTITLWTSVGPFTLIMCGRCAAPVRSVIQSTHHVIIDDIVHEEK